MGLFKKTVRVEGVLTIANVPPNYGLLAKIAFFEVRKSSDPPPFGTEPDAENVKDVLDVTEDVDLTVPRNNESYQLQFSFRKKPGNYYLQARTTLFRKSANGKAFAQVEQFFFAKRPIEIHAEISGLELPVTWPSIPLEDLGKYGEIHPQNSST